MRTEAVLLGIGIATLLFGSVQAGQHASAKADAHASQAERLFARAKPEDFKGDAACAECHPDKVEAFKQSPHAVFVSASNLPLDKRGCEGCHGPAGIHQADNNAEVISFAKMTPAESSAACLRCHGQIMSERDWKHTEHARANVACVSCHQIHPDSEAAAVPGAIDKGAAADPRSPFYGAHADPKAMLKADEATLCGKCHQVEVGQFRLTSHHPIPEGRLACSDCHDIHPNRDSKVKAASPFKDKCVACHTEKAGPFVYEHDPVAGFSGDGCVECHQPHGSINQSLLNSADRGLCIQCHTDKNSPDHHPGQTCWSAGCHVALHGSNTDSKFLQP